MVVGLLLVVLGLLGPLASFQWRRHRWLESARRIVDATSIHFLAAIPMIGLLVSTTGLSILWPPAVLLVMLAGAGFLWAMASSAKRAQARESGDAGSAVPAPATTTTVPAEGRPDRARSMRSPRLRPRSRIEPESPAEPSQRPQRSA